MRDCHNNFDLLGDGRVSLPWPDCLHTSRNQDRRCRSQLGGAWWAEGPDLVLTGQPDRT